jgi:hypothetical protein
MRGSCQFLPGLRGTTQVTILYTISKKREGFLRIFKIKNTGFSVK